MKCSSHPVSFFKKRKKTVFTSKSFILLPLLFCTAFPHFSLFPIRIRDLRKLACNKNKAAVLALSFF